MEIHFISVNCPKKDLKCSECGDTRHLSKNCKAKKNQRKEVKIEKKSLIAFLNIQNDNVDIKNQWYIDSGATAYICNDVSYFEMVNELKYKKEVLVANNETVNVEGIGRVRINVSNRGISLREVNYVPRMCANLLSVRRITESGYNVLFTQGRCEVINKENEVPMEGRLNNGMYMVKTRPEVEIACMTEVKCSNETNEPTNNELNWHRKLGHPSYDSMKKVKEFIGGFVVPKEKCKICMLAKSTRESYKSKGNRQENVLELIHHGPLPVESLGGSKYFLSIVDDYSRKVFIYTLIIKTKGEVFDKFIEFKNLAENQTGRKIKAIRSDNGKEFENKKFDEYAKENGVVLQRTIAYTSEQNGVAERFNRTIMEKVRAMLFDSGLGDEFWGEACNTVTLQRI